MTVEKVLSARSIRPEVGVVCFGSFPAAVQRCTAKRATDRGQDYASVPGGVHEIESVGKVCDAVSAFVVIASKYLMSHNRNGCVTALRAGCVLIVGPWDGFSRGCWL
jgi:hypothetical protein